MRLYECVVVSIWWYAGETHIVYCLDICPFVQEHLRHFRMTNHSRVVERSVAILSETDTHSERDTSRWMIPPTTHRHTCRGTWHIRTHNSNLYSTSLYKRKFKCCRNSEGCKSMNTYIHSLYIYIYTLIVFFQSVIHTHMYIHIPYRII
jgi:hypothetical protein